MARKKRFRALKAALKYLQPTGTDGNGQAIAAPANTQLKKFQDWMGGSVDIEYGARPASSLTKGLTNRLIKLFGGEGTDNLANAKLSNRSALPANMTTAGIDATTLHWQTSGTANYDGDFVPAKAHITVTNTAQTPVAVTSKLTGRKYKNPVGNSYCYPFGTETATDTYKKVCNAIVTKVATGVTTGTTRAVSFRPEDLI